MIRARAPLPRTKDSGRKSTHHIGCGDEVEAQQRDGEVEERRRVIFQHLAVGALRSPWVAA
eukprot:scaffold7116_cov296-Pinguiococcus_pyrenoidosus.AAC.19